VEGDDEATPVAFGFHSCEGGGRVCREGEKKREVMGDVKVRV
jgi:hypothetical protein